MPIMMKKYYSVGERIQVLSLAEEGYSYAHITEITGMSKSHITHLHQRAQERGFNPEVSKQLKDEYVQEAPKSGCPRLLDEEQEKKILEIV